MKATYTKLKSGAWGVRVEGGTPHVGQSITVTKRDGSARLEVIEKIVFSGNGITLCAVEQSTARTKRASRGRRTGCQCGSIEGEYQESDCLSCRHDA